MYANGCSNLSYGCALTNKSNDTNTYEKGKQIPVTFGLAMQIKCNVIVVGLSRS